MTAPAPETRPSEEAVLKPCPTGTTWEQAEAHFRSYISGPGEVAHRAIVRALDGVRPSAPPEALREGLPNGWRKREGETMYDGEVYDGPCGVSVGERKGGWHHNQAGEFVPLGPTWLYWAGRGGFGEKAPTRLVAMILATQDWKAIADLESRALLASSRGAEGGTTEQCEGDCGNIFCTGTPAGSPPLSAAWSDKAGRVRYWLEQAATEGNVDADVTRLAVRNAAQAFETFAAALGSRPTPEEGTNG